MTTAGRASAPPHWPPRGARAASAVPTADPPGSFSPTPPASGLVRHGRPEAWAAGAVIAVARVNGLLGAGRAITAHQVADELDVTLGALAVTEQQLARALNVSSYSPRPLP